MGLGSSFMLENVKYENKLIKAEDFARKQRIGIWEKSNDVCAECIELVELNQKEEYFIIKNQCEYSCKVEGWIVKDDANHFTKLNDIEAGMIERYQSKSNIWNNDGDRFFMFDDEGKLVVFYEYKI
jgi:hypothetical protein